MSEDDIPTIDFDVADRFMWVLIRMNLIFMVDPLAILHRTLAGAKDA